MEIWRSSRHHRGAQRLRAHNESIRAAVAAFRALADDLGTHGFLCECLRRACGDTIELTLPQYEDARTMPAGFVIAPGHVRGGERVVRAEASFWLVEPAR